MHPLGYHQVTPGIDLTSHLDWNAPKDRKKHKITSHTLSFGWKKLNIHLKSGRQLKIWMPICSWRLSKIYDRNSLKTKFYICSFLCYASQSCLACQFDRPVNLFQFSAKVLWCPGDLIYLTILARVAVYGSEVLAEEEGCTIISMA